MGFLLWIPFCILLLLLSAFPSSSISEQIELLEHGTDRLEELSSSRRLLQASIRCPIDIQSLNYTVCTSICKGPDFPPGPCCKGFKDLVCPIVLYFNNKSTDCADQLVSYLNLQGNYPGGLFSNLCVEGVQGLACPLVPAPSPSSALQKFPFTARHWFYFIPFVSLSYFVQSLFT